MGHLPNIYLITDRQQLPSDRLLSVIEELLAAGLNMLQLREKDLSAAQLLPLAQQLRELTKHYNCKLLINDRIDLALAVDADGVHLGGHSLPVATARQLLGPKKLIGASTHSPGEIAQIAADGADFVTFGPVYYTPSKAAYGLPVGLDQLQQACQLSPIPVFALGGVDLPRASECIHRGAAGVAMISALLSSDTPDEAFKYLQKSLPES